MGKTRPQKWAEACREASEAISEAKAKLGVLIDLKSEYEDWKDNLPSSLESSPVAEKLQAVVDLDFDGGNDNLEQVEDLITEAENADLPMGFGRD